MLGSSHPVDFSSPQDWPPFLGTLGGPVVGGVPQPLRPLWGLTLLGCSPQPELGWLVAAMLPPQPEAP